MIDLETICPYTGLRSFTEEESLYFKGRDSQIDQVTALLEKNKFLMVTGASGEGKSSLVYAGLIPNARAGFFKAKYTNWVVADFRPERSPVSNMARSLADKFQRDASTIEIELRRGFSSLIDLYTNSDFFIHEDDEAWKSMDAKDQANKKRGAANLLILVDQFEEFFTNPENFANEVPSQDSQIIVNLILESARIAMKRNLPVYIVCTMRSDYIGQCSAFRGLPEYIGFSQFFVPRLKRNDLKQVIEEPAILSGNRISQRLIERLVYDLSEGVDQLPILQHALSQIWIAASRGQEEMDVIHYAMVGGMPVDELPDEDKLRFNNWFSALPDYQKELYKTTGLNRVIEIHATALYNRAYSYYSENNPNALITIKDTKRIIAITFSCLTKIDNSRAVRNRMSLTEITEIINDPELDKKKVGAVLNLFREEGNSFIRPFKTEDESTHTLAPEAVLDITHESLIRNWSKLNTWAIQEYEYYTTYLDFKKQLDRWKASGKRSGYLLPVGTLSYFENWYNECKPNEGWIRRYEKTQSDGPTSSVESSQQVLSDIRQFLNKSANHVMISRAFMKYGPQRIATVAAILIMLVLSGFYWYDAEQKTNESVIQRVQDEAHELLRSPEVNNRTKATYLLTEERFQPGSVIPTLNSLPFTNRLSQSIEVLKTFQYYDKNLEAPIKRELTEYIYQLLISKDAALTPQVFITESNKFLIALYRDQYYNPDKRKEEIINLLSSYSTDYILTFYKDKNLFRPTIPYELNMGIQLWLTSGKAKPETVNALLQVISPKENQQASGMFSVYYPKGSYETNGRQPADFNQGYHMLASLYAATGNIEGVEWCFQQLISNNVRPYFELARVFNNHQNILGYLYQYGYRQHAPRLVQWVSTNTVDNPPLTIYRNTVIRAGYISHLYEVTNMERNALRSYRGFIYPNLFFSDRSVFDQLAEDYEKLIKQITNLGERNFQLAMNAKRKAMFTHKYYYDRKMPVDEKQLDGWLDDAMKYYSSLDQASLEVLESSTTPYFSDGVRTNQVSRKNLFIYPDYRDGWFSWTYHSDYFFNYLRRHDLMPVVYKSGDDLQAIHYWLAKAFEVKAFVPPGTIENIFPLSDEVLKSVLTFVDQHPEGKEFDRNILLLILANRAFERGDKENGLSYCRQFDTSTISRSADRYEYVEKIFFLNMMNQLAINLAGSEMREEAIALTERFETDYQKAITYDLMADRVFKDRADPLAFVYLDSAFSKTKKINYQDLPREIDARFFFILTLSRIGSETLNQKATDLIIEIPENDSFDAVLAKVLGTADEGKFYRSLTSIPNRLTEAQDLECRSTILWQASMKKDRLNGNDQWAAMDKFNEWIWKYIDYLPN